MVKKGAAKKKDSSKAAVRASISFPPDMYETLESRCQREEGFAGLGSPGSGGTIHRQQVAIVVQAQNGKAHMRKAAT